MTTQHIAFARYDLLLVPDISDSTRPTGRANSSCILGTYVILLVSAALQERRID